ncbi:protein BANP-like [Amblyomma americanum]
MALTLLDHLFDRETQARSNISGSGKHKKQQLDPLMIYGIRCHLRHVFEVTNSDWDRIKLNIDSKCRTAFRRKKKGLPLNPKVFCTENGDFHVVHATAEQIAQIQQTHHIQILNGNHILATTVDRAPDDAVRVTVLP